MFARCLHALTGDEGQPLKCRRIPMMTCLATTFRGAAGRWLGEGAMRDIADCRLRAAALLALCGLLLAGCSSGATGSGDAAPGESSASVLVKGDAPVGATPNAQGTGTATPNATPIPTPTQTPGNAPASATASAAATSASATPSPTPSATGGSRQASPSVSISATATGSPAMKASPSGSPLPCRDGAACPVGSVGPGGGVVFYDAGSEQPWGPTWRMHQ